MKKEKHWVLRPVAWVCTYLSLFLMTRIAEWMCTLGGRLIQWLNSLSTAVIVILVFSCGGIIGAVLIWSIFMVPAFIVSLADWIYPTNRGMRYYVLGSHTVVGYLFIIYVTMVGAVSGGSLFWVYAKSIYLIIIGAGVVIAGWMHTGKYGAKPEPGRKKDGLIIGVLIAVILYAWQVGFAMNHASVDDAADTTISETSPTTVVYPPDYGTSQFKRPLTEEFSYNVSGERVAPFSLKGKQEEDCFCVLKRTSGAGGSIRFFVRKGENIDFTIPLGTYKLYFATGPIWYGREDLFGPGGKYYEVNTIFVFKSEGEEYNGWEVDLINADESNCNIISWEAMP